MSSLSPRFSHSKKFSREGFAPLPADFEPAGNNMGYNDATIDIPLERVLSNGSGLRHQGSMSAPRQTNTMNTQNTQARRRWQLRGRRQKPKPDPYGRPQGKVGYDGEEEEVNTMGKIYRKVMGFSTLTRYMFYVIPMGVVLAVPIIVTAITGSKATIGYVRVFWFFTWIEIIWLSLWTSKTVAHYLPVIFRILAGVVSSGVRKYSMVIKSLEIPLSLVGWAVASLATFKPIMTRNPDYAPDCAKAKANSSDPSEFTCGTSWINIVQKILAATVVCTLIYLVEKLIIQLISINYHRKQFNARIKESKHNIYILGLLYDASRNLFPMYCNEFAEEDYTIADQLDLSRVSHSKAASKHHRSGSHTPIRIIQDIGAAADRVTSMFGHVAQEVTGKQVFNPNSAHSIVVEALEKNRTAEALAKRVWMSFVVEGRDTLLLEDLIDVMGSDRSTEAEEAFWTFDQDGNGDVSLDEFIMTVTQFGRDRKSISSSMHDVDQAINVLDQLLIGAALIVIVLVYVAFLNASFTTTLATAGTALISLSFVFSVTCQEVLGSCIFLFVKHPYDIGDRVDIGTAGCTNQEHFIVEHISLLFTVFRHVQGSTVGRNCQVPNIVLNTLWIENNSRSKAQTEQVSIDIAFETSFEDLQILKNELTNFVTDKENSRDYQPTIDIDVLGTSDQSKMSLMVEVKHKSNWANEQIRRSRRTKFMCALISALKAVPIYPPGGASDAVGSAALPSYSVTLSQSEVKEFADQAAKGREKARLIPSKKAEENQSVAVSDNSVGAGMTEQDNKIASNLNTTNAAVNVDATLDENTTRDDSITLGERPSTDRQDLEDVRGMLRRESTRGKRKVSHEYQPTLPPIPTINEPDSSYNLDTSYSPAPPPPSAGYENSRPTYSTIPAPYRPQQPPQYQVSDARGQAIGQATEMSQLPQQQPARSHSNPYRPAYGRPNEEDEWDGARPYSGV